jgi:putative tryptophan/tyrosine transport system substrate-binding protein
MQLVRGQWSGIGNRVFCVALCSIVFAFCTTALGQQTKKFPRIGFLSPTSDDSRAEAFRQGLRELGYTDGQNLTIEYRWADGRFDKLPELAMELVRVKVDIIVAVVTQASLAAKKATRTIPVVMIAVSDPEGSGLVASLARPDANLTGTSSMTAEIVGKEIELLKDTIPKISRVTALWNPANPIFQGIQRKEAENAARALSVQLQIVEARGPEEIDRAFGALSRDRARALIILNDPVFTAERKRIAELAAKYRILSVSGTLEYTEAGGLMAYGPSFPEMYKRAATYVDKILKGAKPADLPVERPTKFEFVINLKTAKEIGLTIPPNVLARANRVIR